MPDAYATFAVDFEADLSTVQSGMQQGLQWGAIYGQGMAQQFSSGFSSGLSNLSGGFSSLSGGLNMLQGIRGQFASTAQGLSEIFGMKAGAEMAYFRRQLVGMTGDATNAQKTLDGLTKIANETSYGNMDIFQLATNALGSGTSAQDVIPQTSNILDAAAGIGINDPAVFRRFSRNLFDIRGKEGEASQRDVNELYRQAPQFVFQAAKVMGTSVQGARDQISGMSGSDLYNLIIKIGDANKGRAAREGMADPFVAAANAADQFATAMAPTGELVNAVITPLVGDLAQAAGLFAKFNKAGQGVPGFVLALVTTVGIYRIYQNTIGRTTLALHALAMAANRAAGSQALSTVGPQSPKDASGTASALGKASIIIGSVYIAAEMAKALGEYAAQKNFGGYGGQIDEKGGVKITDAEAKKYAYLRMSHPTYFPEQFKGNAPEKSGDDATKDAAKDLKDAAKDLKDAAADGYGYGKRGKATLSSIEAGYALLGAERLGIA